MYILYLTFLELFNPYFRWDLDKLGGLNSVQKFFSWGDVSNLKWEVTCLKIFKLRAPTMRCQRVYGTS